MEDAYFKYGNRGISGGSDGYNYSINSSDGFDFNSHFHECYEFIHIISGNLIYTVEGNDYILSNGDLIMTNPGELHSFSFPEQCDYQREFIHIYPDFVSHFPELTDTLNNRKSGYFNRLPKHTVERLGIDNVFRSFESCCRHPDSETDILMLSYCTQLMALVKRALRTEQPEKQNITPNMRKSALHKYISDHFMENISIGDIARSMFVSPSYLSRSFKKENGITIKKYITILRISRARSYIMEGRYMMKDIYAQCGFSDYSTFFRAFTKYTGMSPEEFKNMQAGGKK